MKRKDEDLGVLPDISVDPSQRFTLWLQNHGPFACQMPLPGGPVEVNKALCPLTCPPGSISSLLRGDRHLQLVVTAGHQKPCPPPSTPHTEESPLANTPPPNFVPPSLLCPGRGKEPPNWHPCLPPIHFPVASCGIYKCKRDKLTSHVKRVKVPYAKHTHCFLPGPCLWTSAALSVLSLPLLLSSCVATGVPSPVPSLPTIPSPPHTAKRRSAGAPATDRLALSFSPLHLQLLWPLHPTPSPPD